MVKPKPPQNHKWVQLHNANSILIRFNYQSNLYKFAPVRGGRYDNPKDLLLANHVANQIEIAIKIGKFEGLEPWLPKRLEEKIGIGDPNPYTIKDVWRDYKVAKADKVSKASQVSLWQQVDRCLGYLTTGQRLSLELDNVTSLAITRLLLDKYSTSLVSKVLNNLHAALQLAVKRKLIPNNPLTGYQDELPEHTNQRKKSSYSSDDALVIIQAFRTDRFVHPSSSYKHSHYANFVEFLFLTGVRPQLAIALTWGDIKGDKIIFNKGFSRGVLTHGKTGRVTHYPLYPQLKELIDKTLCSNGDDAIELIGNYCPEHLVFPSVSGGYIDIRNFTQRTWKKVIDSLVKAGELKEYLPTYHCRHTAASMLAKAGIPSSTIAALLDTSEQMLNRHYFDNQELTNVVIPDLL